MRDGTQHDVTLNVRPSNLRVLEISSIEVSHVEIMIIQLSGLEDAGIAEVYSIPRVVEHASEFGLTQGRSLDKLTLNPDGGTWDFWPRAHS